MNARWLGWILFPVFLNAVGLPLAQADLELGPITKAKLKSFKSYFERYFNQPNVQFTDEILKDKLIQEAKEIDAWLEDSKNWPQNQASITASMLTHAGQISYFFSNIPLEGAEDRAVYYLEESLKKNPSQYAAHFFLARIYARKGEPSGSSLKEHAIKAAELDEKQAVQDHVHYLVALGSYREGAFRQAYESIQRQNHKDPGLQEALDLEFVFKIWIERWGRIPERVIFKEGSGGIRIPVPEEKL